VPVLRNLNLTEVEKNLDMLSDGDYVQFTGGGLLSFKSQYPYQFKKNIVSDNRGGSKVSYMLYDPATGSGWGFPSIGDKEGQIGLDDFSVYRAEALPVSVGEKIKMTQRVQEYTGGRELNKDTDY